MLNNPADMLSMVLRGTLGRSGRKRARRATQFLTGHKGFLSASTIMAAAGVAWGIYDTLKNQNQGAAAAPPVDTGANLSAPPPIPTFPTVPAAVAAAIDPLMRVIQLAISAAKADGTLSPQERALILERARQAGVDGIVESELNQTRPLGDIVAGITDVATKKELYVLAFTIVRADENISGAERIYLAQLANYLGLDVATTQAIEAETAAAIDAHSEDSGT